MRSFALAPPLCVALLVSPRRLALPVRNDRFEGARCAINDDGTQHPCSAAADNLREAAAALVAAGAASGRQGVQEDCCGLSEAGESLSKAADELESTAAHLADLDWSCATETLAAAATSLAAAADHTPVGSSALLLSAEQCRDASSVTGCINLAAAAGPSLVAAACALSDAGAAIHAHRPLSAGAMLAPTRTQLEVAGNAMQLSGGWLERCGEQLEAGTLPGQ